MKALFNRRTITLLIALSTAALSSTSVHALASDQEATSYGTGGQLSNEYGQALFNRAELEQMLAPIALYPDSLLTHILIASTYPLEIVQAHRWQQKHEYLSTKRLMRKVDNQDWDPSVKALVAFPSVLSQLSNDLDWAQNLGDAFLQNEARVLDSIQSLRQQAYQADSLDNLGNLSVRHVNQKIVIEPVRTEVIYVPYYDTRVVYGNWRWHKYPPVYWDLHPRYVSIGFGHGHNNFYWGSGVQISFNYFFSSFHWSKRHVVVTHHRNSHHYRPRQRIVTSHGAKRWQHKPEHRRGVNYRSHQVKQRYSSKQRHHKQLHSQGVRKSNLEKHRRIDSNRAVKQTRANNQHRVKPKSSTRIHVNSQHKTAIQKSHATKKTVNKTRPQHHKGYKAKREKQIDRTASKNNHQTRIYAKQSKNIDRQHRVKSQPSHRAKHDTNRSKSHSQHTQKTKQRER